MGNSDWGFTPPSYMLQAGEPNKMKKTYKFEPIYLSHCRRLFWDPPPDSITRLNVSLEHPWSANLYLPPHWDPRDGTCSHVGLHPHWPHTPHSILGNCSILFFIQTETSLQEPMYYSLSMLAFSDLGLSFSLPTMQRIFLFHANGISPDACFAQSFSFMDSHLWSHHFFLLCPRITS